MNTTIIWQKAAGFGKREKKKGPWKRANEPLFHDSIERERDGAFSEWKSMWGPERGSVAERNDCVFAFNASV